MRRRATIQLGRLAAVVLLLSPAGALAQNFPPTLVVTDGLGNTVNDGDGRAMSEGDTFTLDIAVSDPDGDPITVTVALLDATGNATGMGVYDGASGQWSWTAGQGQAGAYTVEITVCDDQAACTAMTMTLVVNAVALIPITPQQVAPFDTAMVPTATPTLVVDHFPGSGSQPEVDFELYYYTNPGPTPAVAPDQSASVPFGTAGQTSWVPAGIPENTLVYWRVRASEMNGGTRVFSPWSGYWSFFANALGPHPLAPVLVAPTEGEVLDTLTPVLTANNTTDPDGYDIDLYFEVAADDTFSMILATSPTVPQDITEGFTSWTTDPPLEWGTPYAARAYAIIEPFGAQSAYSNIIHFSTRDPAPPSEVVLLDLITSCDGHVHRTAPEHFDVSHSNSESSRPILIELEIRDFDTDTLIAETSKIQEDVGTFTRIPIDPLWLVENGRHRARVRAREGSRTSAWSSCNFWLDAINQPPRAVTFVAPTAGQIFPATTTAITIEVENAFDADAGIPGNGLRLALCASLDPELGDCGAGPLDWDLHPMAFGPGTFTTIQLAALTEGSYLSPDLTVHLAARAVDERDALSPPVSLTVSLEPVDPCDGVACGTGEICDPATAGCVPDGTCGGCPEGSVCGADGLCQETGDPKGCGCDASGSRGSSGWLLLLGAPLLLGLRRRRG